MGAGFNTAALLLGLKETSESSQIRRMNEALLHQSVENAEAISRLHDSISRAQAEANEYQRKQLEVQLRQEAARIQQQIFRKMIVTGDDFLDEIKKLNKPAEIYSATQFTMRSVMDLCAMASEKLDAIEDKRAGREQVKKIQDVIDSGSKHGDAYRKSSLKAMDDLRKQIAAKEEELSESEALPAILAPAKPKSRIPFAYIFTGFFAFSSLPGLLAAVVNTFTDHKSQGIPTIQEALFGSILLLAIPVWLSFRYSRRRKREQENYQQQLETYQRESEKREAREESRKQEIEKKEDELFTLKEQMTDLENKAKGEFKAYYAFIDRATTLLQPSRFSVDIAE